MSLILSRKPFFLFSENMSFRRLLKGVQFQVSGVYYTEDVWRIKRRSKDDRIRLGRRE